MWVPTNAPSIAKNLTVSGPRAVIWPVKKRGGNYLPLHAGQPVNADSTACGVPPELDEFLDGEDAGQVLDTAAVFGMASFELIISIRVAGNPSYVGNAYDVAVQVSL